MDRIRTTPSKPDKRTQKPKITPPLFVCRRDSKNSFGAICPPSVPVYAHLAHKEVNRTFLGHVIPHHLELHESLPVSLHRHQHVGTLEGCLITRENRVREQKDEGESMSCCETFRDQELVETTRPQATCHILCAEIRGRFFGQR